MNGRKRQIAFGILIVLALLGVPGYHLTLNIGTEIQRMSYGFLRPAR